MKKCDGRSRRTAGQTRVTGKRMKQADRHGNFRANHVAARASPPEKHSARAIRDWSRPEQVAGERSASVSLVNGAEIQMHRVPPSFREQVRRRNNNQRKSHRQDRATRVGLVSSGQANAAENDLPTPPISPPQIGMTRSGLAEPPAKQTTRKVVSKDCFAPQQS